MSEQASTPRVSVVIPVFDRAHLVGEAISSVFAQTFSDYELIVVDDGSRDGTPALLASYGERLRVVRFPDNRGVAAARNAGIAAARGELIATLDSDDRWMPGKLASQVAYLDAHPEVDMLTGLVVYDSAKRDPLVYARTALSPRRVTLPEVTRFDSGGMTTMMLRARVVPVIGRFDESYRVAEDIDLLLRASLRVCWVRQFEVHARYRFHPGNISKWTLGLARSGVRLLERWSREPLAPIDAEAIRVALALARYRLAVEEMDLPDLRRSAARHFVQAALADPLVDGRVPNRGSSAGAKLAQLARPWVAAALCALGLGHRARDISRSQRLRNLRRSAPKSVDSSLTPSKDDAPR